MPTQTHPRSKLAGDVFDRVKDVLDAVEASRWMFTGNAALDGASSIQALKAGRVADVQRAFLELNQGNQSCAR